MTYLDAIILGIIEGVTEFLPVSSTGHLILVSYLLGIPDSDFLKSFEIIIQLGAIGAVVFLYWRSFCSLSVIWRLLCSFIPTAVIGFTLYSVVKGYLLGNPMIVVIALAVGGVVLILFEYFHKENETLEQSITDITYTQAFYIGLFQSLALVPGVSRSAATIIGGLSLGLKRITIIEYSFLLAVPTMAAATGYDILKNYHLFSAETIPLLALGFLTAFLVALVVMKFLLKYLKQHSFVAFGVYRIVVAGIFFWLIL
jgi:undecaprenyl-diphosphatase